MEATDRELILKLLGKVERIEKHLFPEYKMKEPKREKLKPGHFTAYLIAQQNKKKHA